MKKQFDILKMRVKFRNLLPPMLPVRIKRRQRVEFVDQAMFFKSSDSDYKILEVNKSCTNDELKKAYRELAKKHHPDKVQNLGEVYVNAAKEKFSKIQSAYENIKKQRGI